MYESKWFPWSSRINSISFRIFRGILFHKPLTSQELSYSKLALEHIFYVQCDYSTIDSLQTFSLCLFCVMGRWLSDDENFFHLQNISHFSMIFTIKFDKTSFRIRFISKSVKVCSLVATCQTYILLAQICIVWIALIEIAHAHPRTYR